MSSCLFTIDLLKSRRQRFLDLMVPNSLAIFPAATKILRNPDVEFRFRQDSNFWYFTQIPEPDHVLVLYKSADNSLEEVLFLNFLNSEELIWQGPSLTIEEAKFFSGVNKILDVKNLQDYLQSYQKVSKVYFEAQLSHLYLYSDLVKDLFPNKIVSPFDLVAKLRLVKDNLEIQLIKQSCRINRMVFEKIHSILENYPYKIQEITSYKLSSNQNHLKESDLEAFILYTYHQNQADWAFWPIVASGPNATVLHYSKNQDEILPGQLLLIDSGCEIFGYASDITRTFEIGEVSETQKLVLAVVKEIQQETINFCSQHWLNRANLSLMDIQEYTINLVCQKLLDLGVIRNKSNEEVKIQQLYKKYYPHKVSHFLGLDVHDLRSDYTLNIPLVKNMVFTVEPGLYFPVDDLQIPKEFRGFGVRIEDDMLITESGLEILTR